MAFKYMSILFFVCTQYSLSMELNSSDEKLIQQTALLLMQLQQRPVIFKNYPCKQCQREVPLDPQNLYQAQLAHVLSHSQKLPSDPLRSWGYCFAGTATICSKCNQQVSISDLLTHRTKHWYQELSNCPHSGCATHKNKKITVATLLDHHRLKHNSCVNECQHCQDFFEAKKIPFTIECYPALPNDIKKFLN